MGTKKRKKSFGVVEGEIKTPEPTAEEKLIKDFTQLLYFQRKQKNSLLGDFADGEYDIRDEKILQALIKLPKKFENQEGNSVYVSAKLDDFVLNFRIDIDVSYSYCDARIWFIEVENTAVEDIKHTTQLDRVVEMYSQEFRQKTLNGWNVYYDDQQIEKDEFLKNLLRMQKEEFLFSQELVAILSQLYLLKMLKFLDTQGEIGEKIKLEYRKLMEEKLNNNPALSQDFLAQKEIMDYVLMKTNALPELLKSKEGKEVLEGYIKPITNIKDKKFETITEQARKEKKETKKQTPSATPKVKTKGGAKSVIKPTPKIDYSKIFEKGEGSKSFAPTIIVPFVENTPPERTPPQVERTPATPPQMEVKPPEATPSEATPSEQPEDNTSDNAEKEVEKAFNNVSEEAKQARKTGENLNREINQAKEINLN